MKEVVGKIEQLSSNADIDASYKALQARFTALEAKNKAIADIATQILVEATSHAHKMDNLREWLAQQIRQ